MIQAIPTGWQCPACKKCYAPHVSSCETCGKSTVLPQGPISPGPFEWPKEYGPWRPRPDDYTFEWPKDYDPWRPRPGDYID